MCAAGKRGRRAAVERRAYCAAQERGGARAGDARSRATRERGAAAESGNSGGGSGVAVPTSWPASPLRRSYGAPPDGCQQPPTVKGQGGPTRAQRPARRHGCWLSPTAPAACRGGRACRGTSRASAACRASAHPGTPA
eukprot:1207180-Prymnesium_polylepis.1